MKVLMMVLLLALTRENRKFNDGSNNVVATVEIELQYRNKSSINLSFCGIHFAIEIATIIFKKNISKRILKPSIYYLCFFTSIEI